MKRILVASAIEPSGASWLLNCFLELDIRIDHKPVVDRMWRGSMPPPPAHHMWLGKDDRVSLHPKAGVLMKFLPALARRADFRFRDDVSVEYVQDLPRVLDECPCVLVVRDPRDAIYSSYCRNKPALSFAEFLHLPNPETLLDRSSHWALFVAAWLALPNIHVVRFEDYKHDATATLRAVLAALGLTCADGDIADAVRLSSFEHARDTERAIRDRFPNDRQVANRSGKVGEGRGHPDVQASISEIEGAAATVLRQLGYAAPPAARDAFTPARLNAAFLGFFDTVRLPEAASMPVDMAASENDLAALLAFARRLDADLIGRAGLPPSEARALLDSLAEFSRRHAEWQGRRLASLRSNFSDGSSYFFERIKAMRQPGKPGPEIPPAASGGAQLPG